MPLHPVNVTKERYLFFFFPMYSFILNVVVLFLEIVKACKMFPAGGSFPGSRGACFAQILMKNLPASSEINPTYKPPSTLAGPRKHDSDKQGKRSFAFGSFECFV